MSIATYNFPTHVKGDTFLGVNFTLSNLSGPINITNSVITLDASNNRSLSSALNEIVITNGAAGEFSIPEQIIDWRAGTYRYKLYVVYASGRKRTYLQGTWIIQ